MKKKMQIDAISILKHCRCGNMVRDKSRLVRKEWTGRNLSLQTPKSTAKTAKKDAILCNKCELSC